MPVVSSFADNPSNTVSTFDKIAITLLSFCPIIQHYKGFFLNSAVSVLLVLLPYTVMKIAKKRYLHGRDISIVVPLILFYLYQVVDHGTSITELGQAVVFTVFIIAIISDCYSSSYFIKVVTTISVAASICIIFQYILYYLFHFHLQMVPTSLLLPRSQQWVLLAQTGRYSITGKMIMFYRPSAFFLEPSHMFIYLFTPTTIKLFSFKTVKEKRTAILMLVGMILTTSGMGILCAAMLYFIYLGKSNGDRKFSIRKIFLPRTILKVMIAVGVLIIAYINIPFLQNSVDRIFRSGMGYTNAISGRIDSGWKLIRTMRGVQIPFGVQDGMSGVTASMSGLNETMFQYGIFGVILSYIFYFRGLAYLKNEFFWVSLIIIIVSLFSQHTHSTMFMIYAVFIFSEGYKQRRGHH